MIYLKDDETVKEGTACALGLFDGVHRGHQLVIAKACGYKQQGLRSAVFTFKTDTVTTKGNNGRIEMILTDRGKHRRIEKLGVDYLFSPGFGEYKDMSCEDFVRGVLRERLNCKAAVCGTDFRFGKAAAGDHNTLSELGEKYGIKVEVVRQLCDNNGVISSTVIRSAIRCGEIEIANSMLGYTFFMELPVEHGRMIARKLEHPTINQRIPDTQVIPRFGVYCTRVLIGEKQYAGVTNVGVKPTFEMHTSPLAETYIIGYDGDLYGQTVQVRYDSFIRAEKKFDDPGKLKEQINEDTRQAQQYYKGTGAMLKE
ncbi:riboflavin biosynthesis protein RibF [Ruminococcus sp. FC2018]|uniref:riboflavin biosynthesis protein RibF n=1 Tax=Ruminococcus sp. FC2018 TaxID=1410617 RepID=UPI000569DFE9|nr:riboflavin biosynthesis protein RibF [Ruminococcus sp. FC2018]